MGPEIVAVMSIASAAIGAMGSMMAASASASQMKAKAKADSVAAAVEAQWSERRQNEELASGQAAAAEKIKERNMIQSKLIAQAGSGASDPTVMDLWKGVEEQGFTNASREQVGAQQRADGLKFQSDMNVWRADANQSLASASAKATMQGATMGAIGSMVGAVGSGMSSYYKMKSPVAMSNGGGTGYG